MMPSVPKCRSEPFANRIRGWKVLQHVLEYVLAKQNNLQKDTPYEQSVIGEHLNMCSYENDFQMNSFHFFSRNK